MVNPNPPSTRNLIYMGSVSAVKRAGSLQMTIPAEASHLVNLKDGDTIFVFYDSASPGQLIILKPSEITLSGTNIRYSIADEEKASLSVLEESGAYLPQGHYVLASGLHSSRYLQVRLAMATDEYATILGQKLAAKFCDDNIEVVAGFSIGGIPLANVVARALKSQELIGRVTLKDGKRIVQFDKEKLRSLEPKSRILVVDDVFTTGSTLSSALDVLNRENRGKPVGIAVVVDRSDGGSSLFHNELRFVKLISINLEKFDPGKCPLCKLDVPKKDLSKAEIDRSSILSVLPIEKQVTMENKYNEVQGIQNSVKEWTE